LTLLLFLLKKLSIYSVSYDLRHC